MSDKVVFLSKPGETYCLPKDSKKYTYTLLNAKRYRCKYDF